MAGALTKVTAQPNADSDPWNHGDKNSLIGMKDINVQRGWEVHSGRGSHSGTNSASDPAERPIQFEPKKVRGDDFV